MFFAPNMFEGCSIITRCGVLCHSLPPLYLGSEDKERNFYIVRVNLVGGFCYCCAVRKVVKHEKFVVSERGGKGEKCFLIERELIEILVRLKLKEISQIEK